ncbi:MAG: MBL fold metallo-hydrolase [Chloroflexota bacterium]|nr:MBL fold metallo-hydrolase [Chloroflexota bacterium]
MTTASASQEHMSRLAQKPRQVHTITDRFSMGNTYLIDDQRFIVVDPGSALNTRLALEYIEHVLHRSARDIDLIVLTHLHTDHTAGVIPLQQACGAPVAASATARQLAQAEQQRNKIIPEVTHMAEQVLPGAFQHLDLFPPQYARQAGMVNVWLDDVAGVPQHLDWRVIAAPGHTRDSLCLYNAFTRELLCGDMVMTLEGGAPCIRGEANRRQVQEMLQLLHSLHIHYLYPGHGRAVLSKQVVQQIRVEY